MMTTATTMMMINKWVNVNRWVKDKTNYKIIPAQQPYRKGANFQFLTPWRF